jgi:hypothetical protein
MAEGACRALMAEAAEEPGPAVAIDWGRAVDIPAMGSVLDAGHNPLGAFGLRAAHVLASPLEDSATPLGWDCEDEAEIVDVDEACEEREPDEFVRWALLRGM